MSTVRLLPLPQRAGTLEPEGAGSQPRFVNLQGRFVPASAPRQHLWRLLDGQQDVPALAATLGWSVERVWSELDTLADDGLLQCRVAPPAGGAGLSRRRLLRGSVPALALAVPGYAAADTLEQSSKAGQEVNNKIGEQTDKALAAEQRQKEGQQEAFLKSSEMQNKQNAEIQNKQNAEQDRKSSEQTSKAGEAMGKSEEQGLKNQEVSVKVNQEMAIKAGQAGGGGGPNAVPEPATLALIGVAGAAAFLAHHLRPRTDTEKPETPASSQPE